MNITQTALLTLTDQWQEKVKRFSDEAHKINRSIPEEIREMPTTKCEHSENLHGYAAGYAAARQELLRLLEVCEVCVGTGTTAPPTGTTMMRVYCWKCKGTGMAKTVEEMIKADLAKNPYYSGPVNCQKCGQQHWIGSDCPTKRRCGGTERMSANPQKDVLEVASLDLLCRLRHGWTPFADEISGIMREAANEIERLKTARDKWSESEILHPLMHCQTCGQLRGMDHACDPLHND